jgi:hypothetical protein
VPGGQCDRHDQERIKRPVTDDVAHGGAQPDEP